MKINPNLKNIYWVHYAAESTHVHSVVLGSCPYQQVLLLLEDHSVWGLRAQEGSRQGPAVE